MSESPVLSFLENLLFKIQVFISRPDAQIQFFAIVTVLVLSVVVAAVIRYAVGVFLKRVTTFPLALHWEVFELTVRFLVYPFLALLATNQAISILTQQGQPLSRIAIQQIAEI